MAEPSVLRIGLCASRPEQRELVQSLLSQADNAVFHVDVLSSASDAVAAIRRGDHDAYLVESHLTTGDAPAPAAAHPAASEIFSAAAASGRPVIILGADDDWSPALLDAGAWDCLPRAELTPALLLRSVALAVHHARRCAAERRQLHARKMDAIARLAGGVAHDFNNLLTAMLGYAEMLRESLDEHDVRRDDVREIQRAGERATALTRQLLTFGLRHPVQPRLLDLNAIVQRLSAILEPLLGAGVQVELRTRDGLDPIRADASQLELLVVNLAKNARDAMSPGGRIRIETGIGFLDTAEAAERLHARPGKHVTLVVADEGRGMSPEAMSHLFEPFFTTKEKGKGTGLGLPVAYGIVRQAGGHITVESEPGRGTTVTVFFPVATEST